jgi:hypothetical protein
MVSQWLEDAKGRTRTALCVGVLFGPSCAQGSSVLLVSVGHRLCVFFLVVALIVALGRSAVTRLDVYWTASHLSEVAEGESRKELVFHVFLCTCCVAFSALLFILLLFLCFPCKLYFWRF